MDKLWKQITPSDFAWEREALAFLKENLPNHEPYRAWANFEFIVQGGAINEVDVLVLTPKASFSSRSSPTRVRSAETPAPGFGAARGVAVSSTIPACLPTARRKSSSRCSRTSDRDLGERDADTDGA